MKNHDVHIESLLEQFMQGETSLEQERELSKFFADSTSIPKEWEAYREMFAYFKAGMPVDEEKPKRNIARPIWALAATAAVAAIAIIVAPHLRRTSTTNETTIPKSITVKNNDPSPHDTIVNPEPPKTSHLTARQECESSKEKPQIPTRHSLPDSTEIEREKGEVEQAQQELMADKYLIEQERLEILDEQYITRVQAQQTQQAVQNENPQFIQVVFK